VDDPRMQGHGSEHPPPLVAVADKGRVLRAVANLHT
jgi:hypothetical protein